MTDPEKDSRNLLLLQATRFPVSVKLSGAFDVTAKVLINLIRS
jgi:hypothetical protein